MNRPHLVGHSSTPCKDNPPSSPRMDHPPATAHAPLVIAPDAVLPPPVAMQRFQAIAGKSGQVCQTGSAVQDLQPSLSLRLHSLEATYPLAMEQGFSILVTKGVDYAGRIAEC